MKKQPKKVTVLYRDMTPQQRDKLPLLERYRLYFNHRCNAKIAIIGSVITADPTNREVRIRYEDGHEVILGDEFGLTTWTGLFHKLSEMHPKPVKDRDLS